jgi:hypothetical protein
MKGAAGRIAITVFLATAIVLALAVVVPGKRTLFVGIYVLVVAAIVVASIVGSFRRFEPEAWARSPFEREPERPERPPPIAELERIDRLVVLGGANEFDLHYRLRPLLRQLVTERLYASYGVDLDSAPDRARVLLGEKLWGLVRPEREVGSRTGPGLPADELAAHVERLERL